MKKKYKKSGSILLTTIIAAIIWVFIAQCMFITSTSGFSMLKSSREALQAQQYAEITIDKLKNIDYDKLDSHGAHSRQQIKGISSDWQDEVKIGSEVAIDGSDGAKQRIATVNVYKKGDTLPRCTLDVPLSSASSSQTNALSDEGFSIKAGVIRANTIIGEHNSAISFSTPFKNSCYGVVVSQSYISSSRNLSVNNLTKNGFTLYAGTQEVTSDIYYIAYGK